MLESDILTPHQASLDIARYIFAPPTKASAPVMEWLRIMTAGQLTSRLRHGYQFPWGRAELAAIKKPEPANAPSR